MFGTLGLDNDGDGLTDDTGGDADCLVNNAPTADAGSPQTVAVLSTVTLDGSLSSDLDVGDTLTYAWTFNSVPGGSALTVLTNPTTVNPTFVPDVPGTYDVQLIVNDGTVDSAPDNVLISTQNSAPVANAGPDQSAPVFGETVTLDGSGSFDVDGDTITYAWTWVTRPALSTAAFSNPAIVNPTFDIDVSGTYEAQLIVDDGTVSSAPDVVQITTANTAPVANAGTDQTVFVTDLVTLDGSGSSDVDLDGLTFSWSITSQPGTATLSDPTAVGPTFTADAFGTYTVQLTVNDGTADSVADTVLITTDNSAPVANAGGDQSVAQFDTVTLDGSASTDVDGHGITYAWSILSGPDAPPLNLPTTVNPTFDATGVGTYVVQLIVTDDGPGNLTNTDTMSVSTTGNTAPVANAGPDQSDINGATITLDGSASSDPDLDGLTYAWSFTSTPPGSGAALANATTVAPSFIIDVSGDYVVQLIVTDDGIGNLSSPPDTVTVTTDNSAPVADAGPDQSIVINDLVLLEAPATSTRSTR
jgi:hypothetical protein